MLRVFVVKSLNVSNPLHKFDTFPADDVLFDDERFAADHILVMDD